MNFKTLIITVKLQFSNQIDRIKEIKFQYISINDDFLVINRVGSTIREKEAPKSTINFF